MISVLQVNTTIWLYTICCTVMSQALNSIHWAVLSVENVTHTRSSVAYSRNLSNMFLSLPFLFQHSKKLLSRDSDYVSGRYSTCNDVFHPKLPIFDKSLAPILFFKQPLGDNSLCLTCETEPCSCS